ncbi:hypothetical protein ACN47E_000776 [Coniothyrium glycines]
MSDPSLQHSARRGSGRITPRSGRLMSNSTDSNNRKLISATSMNVVYPLNMPLRLYFPRCESRCAEIPANP